MSPVKILLNNEEEIINTLKENPQTLNMGMLKYLLKSLKIPPKKIWKIITLSKKPELIRYFVNHVSIKKKNNYKDYEKILDEYDIYYVYHITHKSNLDNIKRYGGLFSWRMCEKLKIKIPVPGGNKLSRDLDLKHGLEYYVRAGFNYNLPMFQNRISKGDMLILEIDRSIIYYSTSKFSNINAVRNESIVGGNIEVFKKINFQVAKEGIYNTSNYGLVQAEILTIPFIPYKMIKNIYSYKR